MRKFDHQDKSTFLSGRKKVNLFPVISPSLMVADQTQLLLDSLSVLSPEGGAVDWLHVDVIDGHFALNMCFSPDMVAALRRRLPHTFLDVH
ncbi:ribulose-phosphate 3-epimerase, partial [Trypanosoma rangeli SC58]